MANILERIVAAKKIEIQERQARTPPHVLERRLTAAPPVRDFQAALEHAPGLSVIAEVKKASPSAGILRDDFDPVAIAHIYQTNGARAISVLTDAPFFQGTLEYLSAIREMATVPLLRKDFLLDVYQLLEARAAGADAVLLIAEILDDAQLATLVRESRGLGMEPLVELYDRDNLAKVLASSARLIGVNNRNLRTFVTSLEHTLELAPHLPRDCCLVSESGIKSRGDLERLERGGVKAVLIGETFMRADDIAAKVREMTTST